jgi:hypothetical protein
MFHKSVLTASTLIVLISMGCGKASDDQKKADLAQGEANDKIYAARTEADKKVVNAQSEADKKIAEAQASFLQLREDYRHKTAVNLGDLDHKVELLAAKARAATGKEKDEREGKLKAIRGSRAEFGASYAALDKASTATWDAVRAQLDKEWTALKELVDKG